MRGPILEFTAHGSPREVSAAVEACAAERRLVSALVVPWESMPDLLNMAVTSSKADGWAIEHINLGTVTLASLGDGRTRVTVVSSDSASDSTAAARETSVGKEPAALLAAFARQIEQRLGAARAATERSR